MKATHAATNGAPWTACALPATPVTRATIPLRNGTRFGSISVVLPRRTSPPVAPPLERNHCLNANSPNPTNSTPANMMRHSAQPTTVTAATTTTPTRGGGAKHHPHAHPRSSPASGASTPMSRGRQSPAAVPTPAVSSAVPSGFPSRHATPHHGPAAAAMPMPEDLAFAGAAAASAAGAFAARNFRFRHNAYAVTPAGRAPKASDAMTLVRASMPPASVLEATGHTPQPQDHLPSCVYFSDVQLKALAASAGARDAAFAAAAREGRVAAGTFVMGQTQFAADPAVHRGVLAVLRPDVATSTPTVHNNRGRTRRSHTGLLHASAPASDVEGLIASCHQRAYYDVGGVWIAHSAAGARELALFELVMAHYRNGVRTGRPMAPVTVERARSDALASQWIA
jgi:hypothetical protein